MPDEPTRFALQRIYVKDISFESPKSPLVFRDAFKPKVHVDMNTRHNDLGGGNHEVVLGVTVTASEGDDSVVYLAEAQQAGVFFVQGLAGEELGKTLGSFCPGLLFPYARELLDSVVVRGGFPPLMLAPINFDAIYEQAMAQVAERAAGGDQPQPAEAGAGAKAAAKAPAKAPAKAKPQPKARKKPSPKDA